jgi:hypothetical protein
MPCVTVAELDAFCADSINIRGWNGSPRNPTPTDGEIVPTQVIRHDQDDVGSAVAVPVCGGIHLAPGNFLMGTDIKLALGGNTSQFQNDLLAKEISRTGDDGDGSQYPDDPFHDDSPCF